MKSAQQNCSQEMSPGAPDHLAVAAKGVLGMVPVVGSLIAELAGSIIPNQRIDRIAKFSIELERRLSRLDQLVIRKQLTDERFTDLMEEGVRQSIHALSDERRQYLSAILANGISSDAISHSETKHLLRILGEINDAEVIWLRAHKLQTISESKPFREIHNEVLQPVMAFIGSDQAIKDKKAIQESFKIHLANLGLLERLFDFDIRTKLPRFDSSGAQKTRGYKITALGNLLLRQIDLWDSPAAKAQHEQNR